ASAEPGIYDVVVTDAQLFWTRTDPALGVCVRVLDKAGGSPRSAFPLGGGCYRLVADSTGVWFLASTSVVYRYRQGGYTEVFPADEIRTSIAADGLSVYLGSNVRIGRAAPSGPPVSDFATGQKDVVDIAVDETNVYWLQADGTVSTLAKANAGAA